MGVIKFCYRGWHVLNIFYDKTGNTHICVYIEPSPWLILSSDGKVAASSSNNVRGSTAINS